MATIPNYGLLNNMADGIREGLIGYQTIAQNRRAQQAQDAQMQLQGFQKDDTGNYQLSPQMAGLIDKDRQAHAAKTQYELDNMDPTSDVSHTKYGFLKQVTEGSHPGSTQQWPEEMSGSSIDNMQPLMRSDIQGQYGLVKVNMQGENSMNKTEKEGQIQKDVANIKNKGLLDAANARNSSANPRVAQRDQTIHNQNLAAVNKDSIASGLQTTYNNLQNAVSNFQKGGATPQEFQELQQGVRSNLGIKGTSGVNERADTYLTDLGLKADEKKQFLFGDLQSVMENHPQLANQVLKMADLEVQNKRAQYQARIQQLKAGHASFYKNHPDLSQDYDATAQAGLGVMGITQPSQGGGQKVQSGGGLISPSSGSGASVNDPDVQNYAQTHNISPAQALAYKLNYMAKGQGQ
jgi:hypothetical protein